MGNTCKNCGTEFFGNYCPQCGQNAKIGRLKFLEFMQDALAGFFAVNRSFFSTAIKLFTVPGDMIRNYIEGKRVSLVKPLTLVIVLAGLYHILVWAFHIPTDNMVSNEPMTFNWDTFRLGLWIRTHYELQLLCDIPFWALFTRLLFWKSGKNYTEHLVLNSYITSQRVIIMLLTIPLKMYFRADDDVIHLLVLADYVLSFGMMTWTYSSFFKDQKLYWVLLKEVGVILLFGLYMIGFFFFM